MDEAVRGISFESKIFKLFIGGSTAGNACSMQGIKIKHNMEGKRLWESWSEIKFRR